MLLSPPHASWLPIRAAFHIAVIAFFSLLLMLTLPLKRYASFAAAAMLLPCYAIDATLFVAAFFRFLHAFAACFSLIIFFFATFAAISIHTLFAYFDTMMPLPAADAIFSCCCHYFMLLFAIDAAATLPCHYFLSLFFAFDISPLFSLAADTPRHY